MGTNDPFAKIRPMSPHAKQEYFITAVVFLVNTWLRDWGKASGKTTARLMLAKAIIEGDN